MLELFSKGIHAGVQRRDGEQKKFCGNKTSTVCTVYVAMLHMRHIQNDTSE